MRNLAEIVFDKRPLVLPLDTSVKDACMRMRERRVGSVLVTDKAGRLLGIFTGRDAVARVVAEGKGATTTKLLDVMTPNPDTLKPEQSAIEALRLMWDGGYRHLPVVKDEKILGVVSRGDFNAAEEDRIEGERTLWEHMR